MSIINNAKEIADLVKRLGKIELYKKIVDPEGDIIELSRENHQQKLKIHDLEKQMQIDQEMVFKKPFPGSIHGKPNRLGKTKSNAG